MKILIVNGYQDNDQGFKQFIAFRYIIQKIFFEQLIIVDIETEFIIRTINNLDDILFEANSSSYISTACGRFFDSFEMVFISGNSSIRPWSQINKSVLTLLRMCLKVKKPLFVTSFAMESVVFLCATNFDRNINVINGNNGGKLNDLCNYVKKQDQIFSVNDFFLDNVTGDLYLFNSEKQEWVTKVNIGLHNHKAAQEFQTLGKYLLKAPYYRPKETFSKQYEEVFVAKTTEAVCYIKKQYLLHYLFQGIPSPKFLVKLKSVWDVHSFSFTNSEMTFSILADSDRGPMIIEMAENIIGVQFEIDTQYSNSIIPIKNWILDKLHKISEGRIIYKSIVGHTTNTKSGPLYELEQQKKVKPSRELSLKMQVGNQGQQSKNSRSLSQFNQTSNQLFNSNEGDFHKFKNSGMAARPDMIGLIVENNNIQDRKIKVNNLKIPQQPQLYNNNKFSETNFNIFNQTKSNTNLLFHHVKNQLNNSSFRKLQMKIQKQRKTQSNRCSPLKSINEDQIFWNNVEEDQNSLYLENEKEQILSQINFTKQLVRKQLHPNLSKNCLYEQKLWVPGRYQKNTLADNLLDSKKFNTVELSKGQQSKNSLTRNIHQQSTKDEEQGTACSIFVNEPYSTQQDAQKKYEKQQINKIIGSKIFRTGISKSNNKNEMGSSTINNVVDQLIENQAFFPQQFKILKPSFRDVDRNKWIVEKDFKI